MDEDTFKKAEHIWRSGAFAGEVQAVCGEGAYVTYFVLACSLATLLSRTPIWKADTLHPVFMCLWTSSARV